jgi:hypothetical protein
VEFRNLQQPFEQGASQALMEKVASDTVIDAAYDWLCMQQHHYHYNNDVWQVRRWWEEKKPLLQRQLLAGTYRFREQRLIRGTERTVELWSAMDALVLKALAIAPRPHGVHRLIPSPPSCPLNR